MLQINLPHSYWNYKICGVYKIQFSDGSFYIGCSTHIRARASAWDSIFKSKKGVAGDTIGTKMLNKVIENIDAVLEIIELCHPYEVKEKEAFYLNENKDNPLMVSSFDTGAWNPVLQYKADDGNFIKRHVSIGSAARDLQTTIGRIQDVLNGVRKSHKNMVFIYENDYKNRRKKIIQSRYKVREFKKGKDVVMFDLSGNEIKRFKKIVEAAKYVNVCSKNLSRALNGIQKTAGGYIFKYETPKESA